jgi:hypothetical protein
MTTVAEMIEWMRTSMPQDAEVMCGVEVTKGYNTYMEMKPVDIQACDMFDYSSPEACEKYPNMAGKCIIMIRS